MASLALPLRQAIRGLRRTPQFTAIAVLTLAVGIGANTAIFSVLDGVLLKALPYPHAERLVDIGHNVPGFHITHGPMAPAPYFTYREQGRTFEDIGMYSDDSVNVTGRGTPERVAGLDVTDGVLPILGIHPLLGRWFTRADDLPHALDTVILMYGYWRAKFGGNRSVIGKAIDIDGKPRAIIGVMPQRFRFLDRTNLALILPMQLDRAKTYIGDFSFGGIARLKPGVTVAQATADEARMIPIMLRSFPAPPGFSLKLFEQAHLGPDVRPLKQQVVGEVSELLWVLMGGIGLVLLIACANVANLVLVRVEGRRQELAIRAALGASRARIAGDLWLESLILSLAGAALGLAFAYAGLGVLISMAPGGLPRLNEITLGVPVLLFTLGAGIVASVLFGSIPILKYGGVRIGTRLREGGRSLSESRERHRARNGLVIIQVALALVLLISSGLMIRTFLALTHVPPGFTAPAEIQTFHVYIPDVEMKAPEQVARSEQEILQKLQALPGVSLAAFGRSVPMDGNGWNDPVFVKDRTAEGQMPPLRTFFFVCPGYFKTVGTPLIAGRDYTWDDIFNKRPVAIVSENFARQYWQDPADALGNQIRVGSKDDWRQIIGVAGTVYDNGTSQKAPAMVYWPSLPTHFESGFFNVVRNPAFVLRTPRAGSQDLMNEVRQAVWSVDPNLPLADVHTLEYFYARSMARTSFTLVMLAIAGIMALLLGIVGIYGVIAYSVTQRSREIGIRLALGAPPGELKGMFVRHALRLALIGVACGLVAAFGLMHVISSLLFGVKAVDPVTYIVISAGLIATAALASYIPARRAAAVNPVEALRVE